MLSSTSAEPEVLHDWRARILSTILMFIAVLGALTAVPSVWLALRHELWAIAWIDIAALAWVLVLWRRKSLPYRFRASNLLALIYLMGVWFLVHIGPVSQIYLMAFPVMAALLLGLRPALLALGINALTLMTVGYLANTDLHVPGFEARPFVEWIVITINFIFINAIITISCAVLLQQLERSLEHQLVISRSLAQGQEDLKRVNEELQRTASALNRLAYFDELTGLPNRRMLMDRLGQALAIARRSPMSGILLYLDLDRFKNINDARGHAAGDALLLAVAQRLGGLMREEDTVARLGGDEFVILSTRPAQEHDSDARAARVVASKVREAFEQPFILDGQPYSASASIGVVVLGPATQGTEDLLRNADTAMYRAKAAGRNRIAFFEAAMQKEVEEQLALESELARSIDQEQLALHLQSQVNATGTVVGVEVLLRWTHPLHGAVAPSRFIPIAEESSLILRLGNWVLEQACHTQRQLLAAGHAIPVSLNVSPRQFHQADFVEQVLAVLDRSGARADLLVFEVTEGLLLENLEHTIPRMNALAARGIRFSIDDFGTGYSSLAYLKRLPLHELKIDRSFIQDTPHDPGDTAIVAMILSMAQHLGLKVVAEGVETRAQADFLAAHGCHAMQGFLYSHPQPLDAWLRVTHRSSSLFGPL
ncbi:bifunctional diguanylate cyclase/phosphodiesterase [Curvibacter sp. PAE-UM]|uniref:putative bifunctional diguanylate cyclase/phosphodiesterase n=1 Tax=Curvibacter sp. PAE-UM TaxID=1714344 RepID=UPI0009EADB6A|nr:EAL domain-containing protein [Curvibacter sp. PAE-UM]